MMTTTHPPTVAIRRGTPTRGCSMPTPGWAVSSGIAAMTRTSKKLLRGGQYVTPHRRHLSILSFDPSTHTQRLPHPFSRDQPTVYLWDVGLYMQGEPSSVSAEKASEAVRATEGGGRQRTKGDGPGQAAGRSPQKSVLRPAVLQHVDGAVRPDAHGHGCAGDVQRGLPEAG